MTNRKLESEMTACEVQGDRAWPSHLTTDEMRKQLRHEDALALETRANALGTEAFKRGIRAPALDNDMLDLMREANPAGLVGNPKTITVLKAWHRGNAIAALNWSDTQ